MKILLRDEECLDNIDKTKVETTLHTFYPIERIREGFMQFKASEFDKYPDYYSELAKGQSPKFFVFACSDSRVCPSNILNFRPREAFISRNIANLVPEFNQVKYSGVGAVIEYAILELQIILVIGHSHCGGIKDLMELPSDGTASNDCIHDWVKIGLPAKAKVISEFGRLSPEEQCDKCEREAVNLSLVNLCESWSSKQNITIDGTFTLWGLDFGFTPPLELGSKSRPSGHLSLIIMCQDIVSYFFSL